MLGVVLSNSIALRITMLSVILVNVMAPIKGAWKGGSGLVFEKPKKGVPILDGSLPYSQTLDKVVKSCWGQNLEYFSGDSKYKALYN